MPEIVRHFGLKHVPQRLHRRLRQLRQGPAAKPARGRHPFTRQPHLPKDAQRIGQVVPDLVRRTSRRPIPVLHELEAPLRIGMPGFRIDDAGVSHHLRMNVPVRHHYRPHQVQARGQFLRRPTRQLAIQPPHTRRIRHDAVLALHPLTRTPLPNFRTNVSGISSGQSFQLR
jgi:hypothetical protein